MYALVYFCFDLIVQSENEKKRFLIFPPYTICRTVIPSARILMYIMGSMYILRTIWNKNCAPTHCESKYSGFQKISWIYIGTRGCHKKPLDYLWPPLSLFPELGRDPPCLCPRGWEGAAPPLTRYDLSHERGNESRFKRASKEEEKEEDKMKMRERNILVSSRLTDGYSVLNDPMCTYWNIRDSQPIANQRAMAITSVIKFRHIFFNRWKRYSFQNQQQKIDA